MLNHSFASENFCISTMIPIPKGNNTDLTSIKNYRNIALSSLLSKTFEHCIIYAQNYFLCSDNLQLAYKPATSRCIVSLITKLLKMIT